MAFYPLIAAVASYLLRAAAISWSVPLRRSTEFERTHHRASP